MRPNRYAVDVQRAQLLGRDQAIVRYSVDGCPKSAEIANNVTGMFCGLILRRRCRAKLATRHRR